jgi:hypothetical protein
MGYTQIITIDPGKRRGNGFERARLQPCRKFATKVRGFSP